MISLRQSYREVYTESLWQTGHLAWWRKPRLFASSFSTQSKKNHGYYWNTIYIVVFFCQQIVRTSEKIVLFFLFVFPYFVFTHLASIYANLGEPKEIFLHQKRVQLPQDVLGTPTWLSFHCCWKPMWPCEYTLYLVCNHVRSIVVIDYSFMHRNLINLHRITLTVMRSYLY